MSTNLICKTVNTVRSSIRNSPTHHLYFISIHPFSLSSLASIDPTPNQHSFTFNYLINSCGFPPQKALAASKYLNLKNPDKPDSVIAFFCNHGFTKTQALNLIRKFPKLLSSNPDRTLLPKIEFLNSKGFSSTDVVKIVLQKPDLLQRSLENQIIPSFNFFGNLIGSEERMIFAIKRYVHILTVHLMTNTVPNVEFLRAVGVPKAKITYLLTYQPRVFTISTKRFRHVVGEVRGMGFDPLKLNFVLAIHAIIAMSKLTWEKKIEVYKKWGLSEVEILVAFRKHPWCMIVSENKITRVMDFLVNTLGWESSFVLKNPVLISLSLEKRILPRCLVYEALRAKGLIKKTDITLKTLLKPREEWFIKKVVNLGKEEAPKLLKLYEEELALAK